MPHKVGKRWRWGSVERADKEDLRRTVYGIWLKNGGKGSFSRFWKTGRVDESGGLSFRKVARPRVPALLDEIDGYAESPRWSRAAFEKYLGSRKKIDSEENSMYYGLFGGDGRCLALSYLNKAPDGRCVLVAQVSCVVSGWGRVLLDNVLSRSKAAWLAMDPSGGEGLLAYYRSFGLEEVRLENSKWAGGREQHFFVKAGDGERERILELIRTADLSGKAPARGRKARARAAAGREAL